MRKHGHQRVTAAYQGRWEVGASQMGVREGGEVKGRAGEELEVGCGVEVDAGGGEEEAAV